MVVENI
jgi:hypothetical protein